MTDERARMLDLTQRLMEALKPGDLEDTLGAITSAAVEVLPQVEHSSITVKYADGPIETKAPSHEFLLDVDRAQDELKEGPCYEAATRSAHVVSTNLAADERFPKYGPYAVSHGIRSQVGLPLFDTPKSQGALNLYSTHVGALKDIEGVGPLFSHQAAVAIAYAHEVGNLNEAIRTRTMIGQATGIVMERYGLSDDRAFAFLTRMSQHRNVKLRLVAQELIAASDDRSDDGDLTVPDGL